MDIRWLKNIKALPPPVAVESKMPLPREVSFTDKDESGIKFEAALE